MTRETKPYPVKLIIKVMKKFEINDNGNSVLFCFSRWNFYNRRELDKSIRCLNFSEVIIVFLHCRILIIQSRFLNWKKNTYLWFGPCLLLIAYYCILLYILKNCNLQIVDFKRRSWFLCDVSFEHISNILD